MAHGRLWVRLAVALLAVAGITALGLFAGIPGSQTGQGTTSFALRPPAFLSVANAQEGPRAGTNFLEEEAGLAAYANAGRTILLEAIRPLFRTIERETSEYIIGSVPAPDYDEGWDVHVYAHRDGWVVAYYLSHEPAVKIMDWRHYQGAAALDTQLDNVLTLVLNQVGVVPSNVGYYHFQHPNATHVMLVADYEDAGNVWDSFQLQIPGAFNVYERGWLHATYDSNSRCQREVPS